MGTATRLTNTGTLNINGKLDEVTGMNVSTNLLLNLDASKVSNIANNASTWTDVGPNRYNFSLINSPPYTSATGYYTFNGTNQYGIATTDFADNPSEITVAAWIKTSNITDGATIVAKCTNIANAAGWALILYNPTNSINGSGTLDPNANQPSFFTQQSGGAQYNQWFGTAPTLTANTWHYVAATLTGGLNGTIKLYLDGVPMTLSNGSVGTVTSAATTSKVSVGSDSLPQYLFPGDIADAQIYNRALSAAEILNNYNAKAALFGLTPTKTAPIMRTGTNTLFVNILDEISLNVGSINNPSANTQGYIQQNAGQSWSALAGQFTVECWIYWNSLGSISTVYTGVPDTGGFTIAFDGTSIAPRIGGGVGFTGILNNAGTLINTYNPAFIPTTGQWYHIAVVRDAANLIMMYVNGISQGAGTTYSSAFSQGQWRVGDCHVTGTGGSFYITGIRVSNTALYTSNFSPPISAPDILTSTKFLMLCANSTSYLFDSITGDQLTPPYSFRRRIYRWGFPAFNSNSPFNSNNASIMQRLKSNGTLFVKGLVQTSL